jgi:hypothetical protein
MYSPYLSVWRYFQRSDSYHLYSFVHGS